MMSVNQHGITERMFEQDGNLHIRRSQDVQSLIDENKELASVAPSAHGDAKFRLVGRIPSVIAEEWSRICGAAIGTKEFAEFIKKQLMNGDFAAFRVKGY